MSRQRYEYDHATDPQFAEFKEEAGPSIPHSKLYGLWYETALVQKLWSQGRTVKEARKLIGIFLLAHTRTPRQAHERTRALISAWCRRRFPDTDLSVWLAKVFEPAIEVLTPKFEKAVGNRNDRRRGRNRRLFQRRIKRGRPVAKDGLRARIAKIIKKDGQSSCDALAKALAVSPRTIESALTRMKFDGQVVTRTRGVYVLPEPTELPKLAKAHQRQIRENHALIEPPFEGDIKTAEVREIGRNEAKAIIEKYEWLGSMPGFIVRCFGIFFDGVCGGVAIYSTEYGENRGVWDKYGFTGKIICLSRGACVWWSPKGSASKLIRASMKMLPEKYKIVTCTVDETAGEIGVVYQACGFDYVGQMSSGGNRASIITPEGKTISSRSAKDIYGTRSVKKLRDIGLTVVAVPRKNRYFGFIGSRKECREHRTAIAHLIQPYPKRASLETPVQFSACAEEQTLC